MEAHSCGCGRIAGLQREVLHRPPLNRGRRTHRAVRVHVALEVPVVGRIGKNQDSDRAALLRFFHFQAAKRAAVPHERDLAFDRHTHGLQSLVIGRRAVVHVNHLRIGVAARAVAMKRGELAA